MVGNVPNATEQNSKSSEPRYVGTVEETFFSRGKKEKLYAFAQKSEKPVGHIPYLNILALTQATSICDK